MGNYYYFWTSPPTGMGEQFNNVAIKEWLDYARKTVEEFPEDYGSLRLGLAEQLLIQPFPRQLEPWQHASFDLLVLQIYAGVLNAWIPGEWLPQLATEGNLAYRWYRDEFAKVEAGLLPDLKQLLQWPLIGRPIWRDALQYPYVRDDELSLMAFWTGGEVRRIINEWPFPENSRPSLYALQEALNCAADGGLGLTMLCT